MSKGRYYPKGPKPQKGGQADMMKQLERVQKQMAEAQEELAEKVVEYAAGGGMVKVVVDGQQNLRSITIDPQVVDPQDVGMLEDLIMVAINGGLLKSQELASGVMGDLTGGLGLPPGL